MTMVASYGVFEKGMDFDFSAHHDEKIVEGDV